MTESIKAAIAIRSLALTRFRNYNSLRLECESAPVVLTGHNGAGKTNLLEAVSFLAPGRGLRRAKMAEVEAKGEGTPWAIHATLDGAEGEISIGTGRDPALGVEADKRIVRIDGRAARAQAELSRHVSLAWLTPQMDQVFHEGGTARRRFLDRLVYGFEPEHAARVNAYEQSMRERNRLLALAHYDAHWVAALERKMAETGAAMAIARMRACDHINHEMQASTLSFPKARLEVDGRVERAIMEGATAMAAEDALADALAESRPRDEQAGRALEGAHRSLFRVYHCEKNMEADACSTGEQKALLLSIVLAEARAAAAWRGFVPMLLLDEVAAHLDNKRRGELFEEIVASGSQAWMTGTDQSLFAGLAGKAQFFQVDRGGVSRQ